MARLGPTWPSRLAVGWLCLMLSPVIGAQETTEAGLNDLVILDPGKHERGLPAVVLEAIEGGQQIDIPPKVHVHRYYYSGDKVFQGPILQGGPTMVVASHPKTGERMYINAVLPPGAPRIAYTKASITYVYTDRRVEIQFRGFPHDPCVAIVKHHSGKGMVRSVRDAHVNLREHVSETMRNSPLVNSVKETASGGADLVQGAKTAVGEIAVTGADSIKTLSSLIPGVTYLKSLSEQRPQQEYESVIERAATKAERQEIPFVRTNR